MRNLCWRKNDAFLRQFGPLNYDGHVTVGLLWSDTCFCGATPASHATADNDAEERHNRSTYETPCAGSNLLLAYCRGMCVSRGLTCVQSNVGPGNLELPWAEGCKVQLMQGVDCQMRRLQPPSQHQLSHSCSVAFVRIGTGSLHRFKQPYNRILPGYCRVCCCRCTAFLGWP